jgi:lysosomal alpha-mannosidase
MGFDAWFFARLDYQDKEKRLNERSMEFVWRSNPQSLGNSTQIFTHAMYNHYSSPDNMHWDMGEGDDFWINTKNEDFNGDVKAK